MQQAVKQEALNPQEALAVQSLHPEVLNLEALVHQSPFQAALAVLVLQSPLQEALSLEASALRQRVLLDHHLAAAQVVLKEVFYQYQFLYPGVHTAMAPTTEATMAQSKL